MKHHHSSQTACTQCCVVYPPTSNFHSSTLFVPLAVVCCSCCSYYADELYYVALDPIGARSPPFPYGLHNFGAYFRSVGESSLPNNVVLLVTPAAGEPMSLTNLEKLVAMVRANLVPGLEFVHLVGPRARDIQTTAQLAHRAVVLMGPHGEWLENALYMRHRAGVLSIADALAREYPAPNSPGLGGIDCSPIIGTPVVLEFNKPVSADVYGYYGYRNCYMSLTTSLGLRYFHVPHPELPGGYETPFAADVTGVLDTLERLGVVAPRVDRTPSPSPSATPSPLPAWVNRPCDPVPALLQCESHVEAKNPLAMMPCLSMSSSATAASANANAVKLCVVSTQSAAFRQLFAVQEQRFDVRTDRLRGNDGRISSLSVTPTAITLYRLPQAYIGLSEEVIVSGMVLITIRKGSGYVQVLIWLVVSQRLKHEH